MSAQIISLASVRRRIEALRREIRRIQQREAEAHRRRQEFRLVRGGRA